VSPGAAFRSASRIVPYAPLRRTRTVSPQSFQRGSRQGANQAFPVGSQRNVPFKPPTHAPPTPYKPPGFLQPPRPSGSVFRPGGYSTLSVLAHVCILCLRSETFPTTHGINTKCWQEPCSISLRSVMRILADCGEKRTFVSSNEILILINMIKQ